LQWDGGGGLGDWTERERSVELASLRRFRERQKERGEMRHGALGFIYLE
jgi:hypothetical protein